MAGAARVIYTIGFSGKLAERFFGLLKEHGVDRLVDIRLRPDGQLSGFAKRGDLPYFLRELAGCDYVHVLELAPTDEVLTGYRASKDPAWFKAEFERLMDERDVPASLDRSEFDGWTVCLLCSEAKPKDCHRSFVADRLAAAWGVEVIHLT
jgi:uncharacterized protein (DUF488 family)